MEEVPEENTFIELSLSDLDLSAFTSLNDTALGSVLQEIITKSYSSSPGSAVTMHDMHWMHDMHSMHDMHWMHDMHSSHSMHSMSFL